MRNQLLCTALLAVSATSAVAQTPNECERLKTDYPGLYYACLTDLKKEQEEQTQQRTKQKQPTKAVVATPGDIAKR